MIRQGDVLLIPTKLPQKAKLKSGEGLRIAGERTGHAHELACDVYVQGEKEYAVLSTEATMTHQEHQHLKIPAGVYEVKIQREYVPVQRTVIGRWD